LTFGNEVKIASKIKCLFSGIEELYVPAGVLFLTSGVLLTV
jgi:hypothetical protein